MLKADGQMATPQETSFFIEDKKNDTLALKSAVIYQCQFSVNNYHDNLFASLRLECPDNIKNSVPKRKAEFLAGRYCATKALQYFGYSWQTIEIGENRRPVWPEGMSGSITHTHDCAKCILLPSTAATDVGIDEEPWLSEETAEQIYHQVLNQDEIRLLKANALPFTKSLTMVFSAKETLFKSFYRQIGEYFGFEAFNLVSASFTKGQGTLQFVPDEQMAERLGDKSLVEVQCVTQRESVVSYCLPERDE